MDFYDASEKRCFADSYHGYGQQQQAEEGTAARPGKSTNVLSKKDELEKINRALAAMDDGVTVCNPSSSSPGSPVTVTLDCRAVQSDFAGPCSSLLVTHVYTCGLWTSSCACSVFSIDSCNCLKMYV